MWNLFYYLLVMEKNCGKHMTLIETPDLLFTVKDICDHREQRVFRGGGRREGEVPVLSSMI